MNNWGANHGAISYGHIGADLITLCSMLRIPVCDAQRSRKGSDLPSRMLGTHSAWIRKVRTSALAETTARFISKLRYISNGR